MRIGIAHHLGWAVAVTAADDHRVVDRRRIELVEPGVATAPIHHEGKPLDDATRERSCAALGLSEDDLVDSAWIDNGPGWLGLLLGSAEEVLGLECPTTDLDIGVVGMHPPGSAAAYEVRAFFDQGGTTVEDPVTGSLHASVARWMIDAGRVTPPYEASQGAALGRDGRVHIELDTDGRIWVGGSVRSTISGTVEL